MLGEETQPGNVRDPTGEVGSRVGSSYSPPGSGSPIPLLLHQIWIDRDPHNTSYPAKYEKHRLSLQRHNPDFTHRLWNERDILGLFDDYPELSRYRGFYSSLYYPIMRADFARVMVIYSQGGVYLDLDFYGERPLSELLGRYPSPVLLVIEPSINMMVNYPVYNGFLASVPGHPFWLGFLDELVRRNSGRSGPVEVVNATGPGALTHYVRSSGYRWEEWLVPTRLILPHRPDGRLIEEATKYRESDNYYVTTMWRDGGEWARDIRADMGVEILGYYALVVTVGVVLLLLLLLLRSLRERGTGLQSRFPTVK